MNFDKVINEMQELQNKIAVYEQKNKLIEDTIIQIDKEISKLEKKIEKETDLVNKQVLQLKILIMKDVSNRFKV